MDSPHDPNGLIAVAVDVEALRNSLLAAEMERSCEIEATHAEHRRSAANLVHYVELRNHDIRQLQARLGLLGLSSLGRSEPSVLATVEAVLVALAGLIGRSPAVPTAHVTLESGRQLLDRNADQLLGSVSHRRSTRIMVTLPTEATTDDGLIGDMFVRGMDIARVNCAHDDAAAWAQMVAKVRTAADADGRQCRIAMDLGGPKLRTGPLVAGPQLVKISPLRDVSGRVTDPTIVWLSATGAPLPINESGAESGTRIVAIPVIDADWLSRRRVGERLSLVDARGSRRRWKVIDARPEGCLVAVRKTSYVETGMPITNDGDDDDVVVGDLPEIEQKHRVQRGDRMVLTRSMEPAPPTGAGDEHTIGCSLAEAFGCARRGERVWLDDGKIGGIIEQVDDESIMFHVTSVRPGGANLKGGKGINLPDTDLRLDALTAKDLSDLEFVAHHADMVSLSFVRRPSDVEQLQDELARLDAPELGIVLKIENVAAFTNLPELLLVAMRSPNVGVMIARGDLAVEVGFDRLAEVQEQIMWLCEAAHVPVIWATQVLDGLARTGQASRAEVTDAAMSGRAECVMLNKGPYIGEAIDALDSILTRMQDHHDKKRSLLRRLRAWDRSGEAVR
jgi:pyruvate kinase